jgi:ABC-type cobalamin/Fe3+-siderophores transport system ATPase subunit
MKLLYSESVETLPEETLQALFERNHLHYKKSDIGVYGDGDFKFSEKQNIVIGPNGGGKTRFLNMIHEYYADILHYQDNSIVHLDFPDFEKNENIVDNDDNAPSTDESSKHFAEDLYDLIQNGFQCSYQDFLYKIKNSIDDFLVTLFAMSKKTLHKDNKIFYKEILTTFNQYLTKLLSMKIIEEGEGISRKLKLEHHGVPVKDDRDIYIGIKEYLECLSPGERNLFYIILFMCCFLRFSNDKRLIILIDEPELHLHTDVVKSMMQIMREVFKEKTVTFWIATHSLHLLSDYHRDEVVLLQNGHLIHRNKQYLKDIVTAIQGIDKGLNLLLSDIEKYDYYLYIQECFERPDTVFNKNKNDPQFQALNHYENFKSLTDKAFGQSDKVKILDYGGGQGRFGYYLEDYDRITYYTYDEYLDKPDYSEGHFKTKAELQTSNHKFNCILLVSTLHELKVTSWVEVFRLIDSVLAENGFLFLCEAAVLSKGEFPYDNSGYLVLGEKEIQALFGLDIKPISLDPRIFAVGISKEQLTAFVEKDEASQIGILHETMVTLANSSFDKVKKYYYDTARESEPKNEEEKQNQIITARQYGFYSQQYINAQMAQIELKSSNEISENTNQENSESEGQSIQNQDVESDGKVDLDSFQKDLMEKIEGLEFSQKVYFSWLCGVRALPMLFAGIVIEPSFQTINGVDIFLALSNALYSVFKALDSVLAICKYEFDPVDTTRYLLEIPKDLTNTIENIADIIKVLSIKISTTSAISKLSHSVHNTNNDYRNEILRRAMEVSQISLYSGSAIAYAVDAASALGYEHIFLYNYAQNLIDPPPSNQNVNITVNSGTFSKTENSEVINKVMVCNNSVFNASMSLINAAVQTNSIDIEYLCAIISNDISCIKSGKIEAGVSKVLYGKIWSHFHISLRTIGCSYWSKLYRKIFQSDFDLDYDKLFERMNATSQYQNANELGNYLSQQDDESEEIELILS